MKVAAPGKLILSGEHAVLYGGPALAMAVNRYVTATITQEKSPQIMLHLSDLAHHSRLSLKALKHLKNRIKHKYRRFIQGEFGIREVLRTPFELAQFALSHFTESLNLTLPHGVKIHLQSDIPIGCGMGSSAATILSVMSAFSHYLDISLSQETLFQLALVAENMQHGKSSGLDLRVALEGGCIYMQGDKIMKRPIPSMPLYLVNTGTPETTTGECVEKVAPHFQQVELKEAFEKVTNLMDAALQANVIDDFKQAVAANHQLLVQIGVVPQKVQQFIAEIESTEGAAKICGAGSVAGEQGGAVLVLSQDKDALTALCEKFGYPLMPIMGETRGVHVI